MAVHQRRSKLPFIIVLMSVILLAAIGVAGYRYLSSAQAPEGVVVLDREPAGVPGYDRSCNTDRACVFGPAWSDDVAVRLGHNGCDTRNDILGEQLARVTYKPSTNNCVVLTGALEDPYTGQVVQFNKQGAAVVQIDHVYPLSVAWSRGASQWSPDRRRDFANDPDNLTAASASANRRKSDLTPSGWLPSYQPGRCPYLRKFVDVARKYQLPITVAEARVIASCS